MSHKGARGGAPRWGKRRGLEASVQLVFSGLVQGSSPERRTQRGGLCGLGSAWSCAPDCTKRGQGGAEPAPHAGAPWTADPHHCERRFLRLIPTSMKTAPAGPPAGLLFWPLAGQLQPGSLPSFGSSPPHPLPFSPPQLPGRPAAFQGFRLGHLDAQRGAAPLIWGRGRINPRVCREGWGRGVKSKRGLQIGPPLLV